MKYYVVSDPHGYDMYLRNALEKAGFFAETKPYKLIICGDLLDKRIAGQRIDLIYASADEGRSADLCFGKP